MNTVPYAIKYRPKKLSEVVGQDIVVQTLTNSFNDKSWHHAYILEGNLGCGKTTIAKIMAAMENCLEGPSLEPCGVCKNCKDIFEGKSYDVMEMDAASNRGIDDIREIINQGQYAPITGNKKYFIIDECLGSLSRVETIDGLVMIKDLVCEKRNTLVKSYNEKTKKIEYKPIIGWFKNSGKDIYTLRFETSGRLMASEGHLISTPFGYKKIKDLKIGDKVNRKSEYISEIQKEIIYGTLLGDGGISKSKQTGKILKNGTCARLHFRHGEKQREYLDYKHKIFSNITDQKIRKEKHIGWKEYKEIETVSFSTKTSSSLNEIWDNTTFNRKKKITKKWIDKLTWLSIAFWYMDDGSINIRETKKKEIRRNLSFSTYCFSLNEQKLLQKWFKNKKINSYFSFDKRCKKYRLNITCDGTDIILKNISKYIPNCMNYKLGGYKKTENVDLLKFIPEKLEEKIYEEKLLSKKLYRYDKVTYDLEIADNNNYFVSGTLVHNCQSLTNTAAEASLKFIEEPPSNVRIILATTEVESLIPTIQSRCIVLHFNKINWSDIFTHLCMVCKLENLKYTDDALKFISKTAKGSMRNSLQNLQNVVSFCGKNIITLENAQKVLGFVDEILYFNLIEGIINEDVTKCILEIDNLFCKGKNTDSIIKGLSTHLRNLVLARTCKEKMIELGFNEEEYKKYSHQATNMPPTLSLFMMEELISVQQAIAVKLSPQEFLEKMMLKSIIEMVKRKK